MKMYVLNTMQAGLDGISEIKKFFKIEGIIGLNQNQNIELISDYIYQKEYCEKNEIPFYEVESYSLQNDTDKNVISKLDIDVLFVLGWQRLIPSWLISQCKKCAIGSHGSPIGILQGRGRSPQNWALLMGWKSFYLSIFQIDEGIDSGKIIDTAVIKYSSYDDIRTSYFKVSMATAHLIIKNLKNGHIEKGKFTEQKGDASYLPQRTDKDGAIDWNRNQKALYNFVRALTKPYPGAFTFYNEHTVYIWRAIPFFVELEGEYQHGQVVKIFNNGNFLVCVDKGFLLIQEHESPIPIEEGMVFSSSNYISQMQKIKKRHYKKYPDLRIASRLLKENE